MITATGLGSGLDIQGLVDSLVAAERAGSDFQLDRQSARLQAKFSALGSLKSALSTFQSSLTSLNSLSTFTRNTATSSDSGILAASADGDAVAGNYAVTVSQLAAAHSLAGPAIASDETVAVGTGSLTFRFGTTDYEPGTDTYNGFVENTETSSATVVIDSSNNTLQGIMTAINDADIGVNASVVFDGSGYRLLMSPTDTGLNNSLEITVADNDGNNTDLSGLSQLAFNASATSMEQTVAAQDAQLTINGLAITSAGNSIDSAIEGLTLTLQQTSVSPVQVTVAPDTQGVKTAVNQFIDGYNQFIGLANALSAYNPDTRQAAALVGDFSLRSIQGQINSILRGSVPGLAGSIATLAELGITTTGDGTLTIDESRFDEVLAADPGRVTQMFTAYGTANNGQLAYLGASNLTEPGEFSVEVTSLAQAGFYSGASVLPSFIGQGAGNNVVVDDDNDEFSLSVDGITASIALTQDTYTSGADLATEIQTQINSASALVSAGVSVSVAYDSDADNLVITSDSSGSDSTVEFLTVDTNTAAELGLDVGAGTAGTDIEALIDGVAATVTGNILTAGSGTAAEGLRVEVNTATTGDKGTITFSRGIAAQLDDLLDSMLDIEGALSDRIDSLDSRLDDIEERRERLELRWEAVRERYTRQFNALDSLLGQLEGTSQFLEQQLSGLLQPNTGGNG